MYSNQFIQYGDIVMITSHEGKQKFHLRGRSLMEEGVYLSKNKEISLELQTGNFTSELKEASDISQFLFQIHPKFNYDAYRELNNPKVNGSSRYESFLRRFNHEQDVNRHLNETMRNQVLQFGKEIQLFHLASKSFVNITRERNKGHSLYLLKLTTEGSKTLHFKVKPFYSFRKDGDRVSFDDVIIFENVKHSAYLVYNSPSNQNEDDVEQILHQNNSYKADDINYRDLHILPTMENSGEQHTVLAGSKDTDQYNTAESELQISQKGSELPIASSTPGHSNTFQMVYVCKESPLANRGELFFGQNVKIKGMNANQQVGYLVSETNFSGFSPEVYFRLVISKDKQFIENVVNNVFQITPLPFTTDKYGDPMQINSKNTSRFGLKHMLSGFYLGARRVPVDKSTSWFLVENKGDFLRNYKKVEEKIQELSRKPEDLFAQLQQAGQSPYRLQNVLSWHLTEWFLIYFPLEPEQMVYSEMARWLSNPPFLRLSDLESLFASLVSLEAVLTTSDERFKLNSSMCFAISHPQSDSFLSINYEEELAFVQNQLVESNSLKEFFQNRYTNIVSTMRQDFLLQGTPKMKDFFFIEPCSQTDYLEHVNMVSCVSCLSSILVGQSISEIKLSKAKGLLDDINLWCSPQKVPDEPGSQQFYNLKQKQWLLQEIGIIDLILSLLAKFKKNIRVLVLEDSFVSFIVSCVDLLLKSIFSNYCIAVYVFQFDSLFSSLIFSSEIPLPEKIKLDLLLSQLFVETKFHSSYAEKYLKTVIPYADFESFDFRALNIIYSLCHRDSSNSLYDEDNSIMLKYLIDDEKARDSVFKSLEPAPDCPGKVCLVVKKGEQEVMIDSTFDIDKKTMMYAIRTIELATLIAKMDLHSRLKCFKSIYPLSCCMNIIMNRSVHPYFRSCILEFVHYFSFDWKTRYKTVREQENPGYQLQSGVAESMDWVQKNEIYDHKTINTFFNEEVSYKKDNEKQRYNIKKIVEEYLWQSQLAGNNSEGRWAKSLFSFCRAAVQRGFYTKQDLTDLKAAIYHYLKFLICTLSNNSDSLISHKSFSLSSRLSLSHKQMVSEIFLPELGLHPQFLLNLSNANPELIESLAILIEILHSIEKDLSFFAYSEFFKKESSFRYFDIKKLVSAIPPNYKNKRQFLNQFCLEREDFLISTVNSNFALPHPNFVYLLIEFLSINNTPLVERILQLLSTLYTRKKTFLEYVNRVQVIFKNDTSETLFKELKPAAEFLHRIAVDLKQPVDALKYFQWINKQLKNASNSLYRELSKEDADLGVSNALKGKGIRLRTNKREVKVPNPIVSHFNLHTPKNAGNKEPEIKEETLSGHSKRHIGSRSPLNRLEDIVEEQEEEGEGFHNFGELNHIGEKEEDLLESKVEESEKIFFMKKPDDSAEINIFNEVVLDMNYVDLKQQTLMNLDYPRTLMEVLKRVLKPRNKRSSEYEEELIRSMKKSITRKILLICIYMCYDNKANQKELNQVVWKELTVSNIESILDDSELDYYFLKLVHEMFKNNYELINSIERDNENAIPFVLVRSMWRRFARMQHKGAISKDLRVCSNIANILHVFFKYFDLDLQSFQVLYSHSIKTGMDFVKVKFNTYLTKKLVPFLENNPYMTHESSSDMGVKQIVIPYEISFVISFLTVVQNLSNTKKTTVLSQNKAYISLSTIEHLFEKSVGWIPLKNALSRYLIRVYLSARKSEDSEMDQLAILIKKLVSEEHRQFSDYVSDLFANPSNMRAVFRSQLQDIQGAFLYCQETPYYCPTGTQSKFDEYIYFLENGVFKIVKKFSEKISKNSSRDVEVEALQMGVEKVRSIARTLEYAKSQFAMMRMMDFELIRNPRDLGLSQSQPLDRAVIMDQGKASKKLLDGLFKPDTKSQRNSSQSYVRPDGPRLTMEQGTPVKKEDLFGRGRRSSISKGIDLRASDLQKLLEEKEWQNVSEPGSRTEDDSLNFSMLDGTSEIFISKELRRAGDMKNELEEICKETEKLFKLFSQHDFQSDFRVTSLGQIPRELLIYYDYSEMGVGDLRLKEEIIRTQHQKEFDQLVGMLVLLREKDEKKFSFILQQLMQVLESDWVQDQTKYFTLKMIRSLFNFASKAKNKNIAILEDLSSIGFINFTCKVIAKDSRDKRLAYQFILGLIDFLSEPCIPTQARIYAYMKSEENHNFFIHSILDYLWTSTIELRQHELIYTDPRYVYYSSFSRVVHEKSDLSEILSLKKEEIMTILDFIHLACENHFGPIQNILRTQSIKLRKVLTLTNMVSSLAALFDKYRKIMSFQNVEMGIKFIEVFTELCQGPCAGNQQELAKTKLFQNLEDILIAIQRREIEMAQSHKSEFIRKAFILFLSIAEGSNDEILFDKVLLHLPVDFVYQRLQGILLKTKIRKQKKPDPLALREKNKRKSKKKPERAFDLYKERIMKDMYTNFLKLTHIDNKVGSHSAFFLDEALQMGITLKFFKLKMPSFQTRLMNYHNAQLSQGNEKLFLKTKHAINQQIGSVEIVNSAGQLEVVHFPLIQLTRHLSEYYKEKFHEDVNRDSPNEKIFSMLREIPGMQEEMVYFEKLHRNKIFINVKHFAFVRNLNLLLCLVINLYILFNNIYYEDEGNSKDSQDFGTLIFILGALQAFLSVVIFLIWVVAKLFLEFQAIQRNYRARLKRNLSSKVAKELQEGQEKGRPEQDALKVKRKRYIVGQLYDAVYYYYFIASEITFKTYLVYLIIYMTLSGLGLFFSEVFYSFLMLDIVDRSAILKNVILSVSMNYTQLIMTAILTLIFLFVFTSIGFFTKLRPTFVFIEGGSYLCDSMIQCFVSMAGFGFRSGGGIGEVVDYPDYTTQTVEYVSRYFFDLFFFVAIIIVMLNIVFGIIIDTFADLRDKRSIKEYDRKQRCFICSTERSVFEKASLSFKRHVEKEHFLWHYVYFIVYLNTKKVSEYTGVDTYVREKVDREDLSWVPIKCAMVLKRDQKESNLLTPKHLLKNLDEIEGNLDQVYDATGIQKPNEL